jgi:hypothetical protein
VKFYSQKKTKQPYFRRLWLSPGSRDSRSATRFGWHTHLVRLIKKPENSFSAAVKKMGAVAGAHGNAGSQEAS